MSSRIVETHAGYMVTPEDVDQVISDLSLYGSASNICRFDGEQWFRLLFTSFYGEMCSLGYKIPVEWLLYYPPDQVVTYPAGHTIAYPAGIIKQAIYTTTKGKIVAFNPYLRKFFVYSIKDGIISKVENADNKVATGATLIAIYGIDDDSSPSTGDKHMVGGACRMGSMGGIICYKKFIADNDAIAARLTCLICQLDSAIDMMSNSLAGGPVSLGELYRLFAVPWVTNKQVAQFDKAFMEWTSCELAAKHFMGYSRDGFSLSLWIAKLDMYGREIRCILAKYERVVHVNQDRNIGNSLLNPDSYVVDELRYTIEAAMYHTISLRNELSGMLDITKTIVSRDLHGGFDPKRVYDEFKCIFQYHPYGMRSIYVNELREIPDLKIAGCDIPSMWSASAIDTTHDDTKATIDDNKATIDDNEVATHDDNKATTHNDNEVATHDDNKATTCDNHDRYDNEVATHDDNKATIDDNKATIDDTKAASKKSVKKTSSYVYRRKLHPLATGYSRVSSSRADSYPTAHVSLTTPLPVIPASFMTLPPVVSLNFMNNQQSIFPDPTEVTVVNGVKYRYVPQYGFIRNK